MKLQGHMGIEEELVVVSILRREIQRFQKCNCKGGIVKWIFDISVKEGIEDGKGVRLLKEKNIALWIMEHDSESVGYIEEERDIRG